MNDCCCLFPQAIAEWGRAEPPPYILRLRLLLHEISHTPQYTSKVQDTALDAGSSSARSAAAVAGQPSPSAAAVSPGSRPAGIAGLLQGAAAGVDGGGGSSVHEGDAAAKDYVESLGKGVILGTPRMPASIRITAEVLKHGKPNVGATPRTDEQQVAAQ